MTVHSRNMETEKASMSKAVRSLEAQVVQIPQWNRMIECGRQKSNTLQADVLRLGAENLQLSQRWHRSKEKVAQLQARCNEFWHHPEPHSIRERKDICQDLEWMQMEECCQR